MKLRKSTTVAITMAAALAITVSLSGQNSLSSNFEPTAPSSGDGRSQVIVYSDSLADNGNIYKLFGFPPQPSLLEWELVERPRRCAEHGGHPWHAVA